MSLCLIKKNFFVFCQIKNFLFLFLYFRNDETNNVLSCAILRFFCKIVPYLSESDILVRDFINCGFITSLQVNNKIFYI